MNPKERLLKSSRDIPANTGPEGKSTIKVKFFTLLRLYLDIDELEIEAEDVDILSLLKMVKEKIDNNLLLEKLLDENGSMHTGTLILINGHDIHHMEMLDTIVKKGDTVSLFPPGGGG